MFVKRFAFYAIFLIYTILINFATSSDNSDGLPLCGQFKDNQHYTNLLLVSTLDGHLTALELNDGAKKWSVSTGAPLLSSNIHHLELTSEGQWARLVPSLSGTLYKLAGESLQPLPLNADHLLSSSYKYSDDLVIAGGRETASFGVDALSGRIVWQCEMRGCTGNEEVTAGDGAFDKEHSELLLLRRTAHTVRALETKSGQERWNFSVGEHDVTMAEENCIDENEDSLKSDAPETPLLKVIMPEGLVQAHNPLLPETVIWEHKLESPITGAWRVKQGKLETVDILRVGFGEIKSKDAGPTQNPDEPSVYIGVHNNQLYIQESPAYRQLVTSGVSLTGMQNHQKLSWHSRPAIETETKDATDTALVNTDKKDLKDVRSKALQALYAAKQTVTAGVFLYEVRDNGDRCNKDNHSDDYDIDNTTDGFLDHTLRHINESPQVHILVVSLWFWWKEVLVIAVSSALLLNLIVTQRVLFRPTIVSPNVAIQQEYAQAPAPSPQAVIYNTSFSSDSSSSNGYSSRYESDFSPLRCLGRGGFGVVFEAKNNIDDCSYAVKRITLPDRKSQRDRVLREVRALAKLEHPHIVRYFNAWLEQPPSGWQEEKDKHLFKEFNITSQPLNSLYTSTNTSVKLQATEQPKITQHPNIINLKKDSHEISCENCFDALKYNYDVNSKSVRSRSYSLNDSFSIIFDDQAGAGDSSANVCEDKISNGGRGSKDLNSKSSSHGEDSFIVFVDSKRDRARESIISIMENEKQSHQPKKPGHRRHWSLDMSASPSIATVNTGKVFLYIQMQLCQPDSLHEWLRQNTAPYVRKSQVPSFFNQIVAAVEYVHLAGLIHRDLKPSNILFAPDGSIKVGDFGLVTEMLGKTQNSAAVQQSPEGDHQIWEWKHTHRVGTHLYMSPEQAVGASYSFKVDIFSLGLILFELLFPFSTESERIASLLQLREGIFPNCFIQEYPKEHELLELMLSHEPVHRPTAEGVRKKSWHLFEFDPSSSQADRSNS